jgi:hypothetical protein
MQASCLAFKTEPGLVVKRCGFVLLDLHLKSKCEMNNIKAHLQLLHYK